MLKILCATLFKVLIIIAYQVYQIEGINTVLLIMPAKLIVPTLRKYGATIGENVIIHSPLIIHNAGDSYSNLNLGNDVYFGRSVFLDLKDKITVHDRVTISMRVTLLTHTNVGKSKLKKSIPPSQAPLIIEKDAYIGANATILQGVHVGAEAVIGAGSVVLHPVPDQTAVAGNPAHVIKKNS